MKTKAVKIVYTLCDNKKNTSITEEVYNITKETEKMIFLSNETRGTKQLKSAIGDIVVEIESSTMVRLRVWCYEKDVAKTKKLLKQQLSDLVTTWNKSTKNMLSQLK